MNDTMTSNSFTIADIRAIRERCYEKTLGMTRQERISYFNSLGSNVKREMTERKARRAQNSARNGQIVFPTLPRGGARGAYGDKTLVAHGDMEVKA